MSENDERNLTKGEKLAFIHRTKRPQQTKANSYRGKLFEEKCLQKVMDVEIKSGALIDNTKFIHILR